MEVFIVVVVPICSNNVEWTMDYEIFLCIGKHYSIT
jgi:hypothetical protein